MEKAKCIEMKVHNEKIQESTTSKTIVLPLNLENSSSNIDDSKMDLSERVCQFFQRGRCGLENCEFKHEKPAKSSDMKNPGKENDDNEIIRDEIKDDSKSSKRQNEGSTSKSNATKHKKVKYDSNDSKEDAKVNSGVEINKAVNPLKQYQKLLQIQRNHAELKRQQQAEQQSSLDEYTAMPSTNIDSTIMENLSRNNETEIQNGAHQDRKKELNNHGHNNMVEKKTEESNSSERKHKSNPHFQDKCEFCEEIFTKSYQVKKYHIYSCHFKNEIDNELDWKCAETVCPIENCKYIPKYKGSAKHYLLRHFIGARHGILDKHIEKKRKSMSKNSNTSNIDFSKKDTTDESIDDSKNTEHANEENISKSNVEKELKVQRKKGTDQDKNHMIITKVEDVIMDNGGNDTHKKVDATKMKLPSLPEFVSLRNGNSDPCLEKISKIYTNVGKLIDGLQQFVDNRESKEYRYFDEMFTQNLVALDDLRVEGRNDEEKLRSFRKVLIKSINHYLNILETKASDKEKMDTNKDKDPAKEIDDFVNDIEVKFRNIQEKSILSRIKNTQANEDPNGKSEIKTSNLKPFKCELCRKAPYSKFSALQQHKKKVHGIFLRSKNLAINDSIMESIEAPSSLENQDKSSGSELADTPVEKILKEFNHKKQNFSYRGSNLIENEGKFNGSDLLEDQDKILGSKLVFPSIEKTPDEFIPKKPLQISIKPIESMMNKKISDKDENQMEIKKCLMCEETFSGVGDTLKKSWFKHLSNKKHFRKEFQSEIHYRLENAPLKCQECDFTNPSELGIHIVREHGNAILQNLYDSEIESVTYSFTMNDKETTKDSINVQKNYQEDHISKTDKLLEDQYDVKGVMATQNEILDSDNDSQRKMQVKTGSLENQEEKLGENDVVIIKKEVNKLTTTKIKIKINHDHNEENRVIHIAKPPYHVTLYDVKEYLEKKPFFKVLKGRKLEYHAKYRESDGTTCLEEIEHDNLFLPNINEEIYMECWSVA